MLENASADLLEKTKSNDFLHQQLNEKSALTRNIMGTTSYSGSGLVTNSRDIPSSTESRLKYSTLANMNAERSSDTRMPIERPVIKRYTGSTPIKERPRNEDAERTLSPSMARLNQQADP